MNSDHVMALVKSIFVTCCLTGLGLYVRHMHDRIAQLEYEQRMNSYRECVRATEANGVERYKACEWCYDEWVKPKELP